MAAVLALLAGLLPGLATAQPRVAGESVHVTSFAAGAKLQIHIPGVLDRVLWSKDQVDAVALADVDNDGDLDLLAANRRAGLMVWRNTARGFELAGSGHMGPRRTDPRPDLKAAVPERDAAQVGDEHRNPPSISIHGAAGTQPTVTADPRVERESLPSAPHASYAGRAPPDLS